MASALERKATRPRLDSLRSTTSSTAGGFVRPPSPTFSQTTIGSLPPGANAPHLLITRADLRESLGSYEELMSSAKQYRQALLAKSEATARLAAAMEACSRVKGADHSGPGLMSCAGFNHVVSNSEQVLARSFYEDFEIPLLHSLDTYRQEVSDRQANYESTLVAKTKEIRRTESENIRQGKRKGKGRDLSSFRKTLGILQSQVDELDKIKGEYYGEVLDGEDEMWEYLLSKIGMVVKTHVDVYDRLTTKGNDPILEPLLAANPDPFEAYGQADQTEGMFSILPPIGILPPTGSTSNLLSLHSAAIGRTSHPVLTGSNQSSQPLTPKSSRPSTSVAQDSTDEPSPVNLSAEDDDDFLSPRKVESQTDRFGWMMGSKAGSTNGDLLEEEGEDEDDITTPRKDPRRPIDTTTGADGKTDLSPKSDRAIELIENGEKDKEEREKDDTEEEEEGEGEEGDETISARQVEERGKIPWEALSSSLEGDASRVGRWATEVNDDRD